MKKRIIVVLTAGLLIIGLFTGFTFAKEKVKTKNTYKDMIKIMREYGYKDLAKAAEKGDYKTMDEFMNNLTDEDYQNMIDIMKQSGYGNMARMMESISREDMIKMHNTMRGAQNYYGENRTGNSMMGNW